jgi:hypothetical protein
VIAGSLANLLSAAWTSLFLTLRQGENAQKY